MSLPTNQIGLTHLKDATSEEVFVHLGGDSGEVRKSYQILAIVLPAYNEASVIQAVLHDLPRALPDFRSIRVLVIDDGSGDETSAVARAAGAEVIRHRLNRGVGLATITGLAAARQLGADVVVMLDSDGQHDPKDIEKIIQPIIDGQADFVLGTRLRNPKGMPLIRRFGNRAMNFIVWLTSGVKASDSQSGFRAYSRYALDRLSLTTSGYEVCTEILLAARRIGLRQVEVPIKTIYSSYSKRKGQPITNALNILVRLFVKAVSG
jgi:glycosyltransferase involved in cell wall biosynthesis